MLVLVLVILLVCRLDLHPQLAAPTQHTHPDSVSTDNHASCLDVSSGLSFSLRSNPRSVSCVSRSPRANRDRKQPTGRRCDSVGASHRARNSTAGARATTLRSPSSPQPSTSASARAAWPVSGGWRRSRHCAAPSCPRSAATSRSRAPPLRRRRPRRWSQPSGCSAKKTTASPRVLAARP